MSIFKAWINFSHSQTFPFVAVKFLEKGDKVKVTLRFRGREMAHMASSKHILDDFAEQLTDCAMVEKPAKVEGRSMAMVLAVKR